MEFPDLGTNCSWPPCKALDFLPFTCIYCKLVFCKDHYHFGKHECKSADCEVNDGGEVKIFTCSSDNCKITSPVEIICPKCNNHFCLEHRYHSCFNVSEKELEEKRQIWNAPKEQFAESIKEVNAIVNKGLEKAKLNPKKQATALKVQLMRLKGKAKGASGIPSSDRLYFLILLPKKIQNSKCKAVFVSKDWSVGKVVDSVATVCDVVNKNNEMKAPKLRLFRKIDGTQVSTDLNIIINDLIINNSIANGESLILEYIDPNEDLLKFNLSNYDEYVEGEF